MLTEIENGDGDGQRRFLAAERTGSATPVATGNGVAAGIEVAIRLNHRNSVEHIEQRGIESPRALDLQAWAKSSSGPDRDAVRFSQADAPDPGASAGSGSLPSHVPHMKRSTTYGRSICSRPSAVNPFQLRCARHDAIDGPRVGRCVALASRANRSGVGGCAEEITRALPYPCSG